MTLKLSDGERLHPLWIKLEQHFKDRLTELRSQNDALLNDQQTAFKRGQIQEVKDIIDLGKEPNIIE